MNYFILASGLLIMLLSISHFIWGEKSIAPDLKKSSLSTLTKAGFYVAWNQIGSTLFVSGAAVLIVAFQPKGALAWALSLFVALLLLGNFLTFLAISFKSYPEVFIKTVPQSLLFVIILVLLILGMVT